MAAGQVSLRTLDDARAGRGLTHDIDGERGRHRGFGLPQRTPEEAARIFWSVAAEADFTLFEHFLADEAGHARDEELASRALDTFDRFAREVIALRPDNAHVLICSDHGNVEDLSTRSHTLHPVPVLYFGGADWVPGELGTVADVGRIIMRLLGVPWSEEEA
jgi:phosphopentomutase